MQRQIDMEVAVREERGKNAARRLRAAGRVPAVVYGLGRDSQAVSIDSREMVNVLKDPAGHNRVFNLRCDGAEEQAMAVDYQIDPVQHSLLHVDLQRVDVSKSVRVSVPVATFGMAFGVKNEGGFEEMVSREVHVECLPLDIPEQIEIDVTEMHLGDTVRVKDLPTSDKYKLVDDEDKLVVHVMASRLALELEEAEAAAAAEAEAEEGAEGEAPAEGEAKAEDKSEAKGEQDE